MRDTPLTVIHILALGRSGSTLLETLLWEAFGALALGEMSAVLLGKKNSSEGTDEVCSCGKRLEECSFWGAIMRERMEKQWTSVDAKRFLESVLEHAAGRGAEALTDSSPSPHVLPALRELEREGKCRLKVVYLTRLPQGWIVLYRKTAAHAYRGVRRLFYGLAWRIAQHWYRQNKRCMALAESLGISYQIVSYEQLALAPESTLEELRRYLGLEPRAPKADMRHISYSHKTKFTTLSVRDIVYDDAWLKDRGAQLAVALSPRVRRLAKEIVPLPDAAKRNRWYTGRP